MLTRFPKDDKKFSWTAHIKNKMLYYGISEQKIRAILKSPDRAEQGIAEGTNAVMKKKSAKKNSEELWVMYAETKKIKPTSGIDLGRKPGKLLMISVWRYPGVSKPGKAIPIPDDIREELGKLI